jgi:hypothetical protein
MDSSEDDFYQGTRLQQRKADLAHRRALESQDYYNNRGMKYSNSNPTIKKYAVPSQNSQLDAFR